MAAVFKTLDDLKHRKAIDGALVTVNAGLQDGDGQISQFAYNATSSASVDNINVYQPGSTDATVLGRWLRVNAPKTDDNAAAITALTSTVSSLPDKIYVSSVVDAAADDYVFEDSSSSVLKQTTITPTNAAVVAGDDLSVVINKLQGQINAILAGTIPNRGAQINATNAALVITSLTAGSWWVLPVITANRTITLPSATGNAGKSLLFINANTAGFAWSFTGTNLKDANGTTVTAFANDTVTTMISDGTNWIKTN